MENNIYTPLHTHSIYSIRDSIAKIPDIIKRSKELGIKSYALSDHGTLGGSLSFYKEAMDNDIKPIMASEVYVSTRSRLQKEHKIDGYYHLTLIAMNMTGWKNLSHMVSEAYEKENFYKKPRIDRELLSKYNEGIICLSGCVSSNLVSSIMRKLQISIDGDNKSKNLQECSDPDATKEQSEILKESPEDVVKWHKNVFGDRYYLEVQNHNMGIDDKINDYIYELSRKFDIPTVATGDTHFVLKDDVKAHDIMLAIRGGFSIHDTEKMSRASYTGDGYHILSYDELLERFPGHKESIENTNVIADRCNVEFDLNNFKLPHIYDYRKEDDIFREKVYDGLYNRYGKSLSMEIIDRAENEINTIIQMTFPSYFLLVSNYVKWCKIHNIPVGPGRGSAGGSLIAYALEITEVDPLKYNLSFSRFLNKGRSSIPVIDFDEFPYAEWQLKKMQSDIINI